jgi:hypothetical protein
METRQDRYYLKLFAAIKWAKGFKCKKEIDGRRCGYAKAYAGKKPFSLRCKKCGHLETATAGTAFDGIRMPISTAIEILDVLKYNYSEFERDETYEYGDKNLSARLPLRSLSKHVKRTPKAIGAFLKRVGAWLPEYVKNDSDWEFDFLKNLKSGKSITLHARIFGLLYPGDDVESSVKEIIYQLVFNAGSMKRDTYYDRMEEFFDKHGNSFDFDFYRYANVSKVLPGWWESFLMKHS